MTEYLSIAGDNLAYEVSGRGPLVLAHGIGDSRPGGLGELAVIEGAGHYPHVQTPDQVLALARPFLDRTLANA